MRPFVKDLWPPVFLSDRTRCGSVAVGWIFVVFGWTGVGHVPSERVWIQRRHWRRSGSGGQTISQQQRQAVYCYRVRKLRMVVLSMRSFEAQFCGKWLLECFYVGQKCQVLAHAGEIRLKAGSQLTNWTVVVTLTRVTDECVEYNWVNLFRSVQSICCERALIHSEPVTLYWLCWLAILTWES